LTRVAMVIDTRIFVVRTKRSPLFQDDLSSKVQQRVQFPFP
jgi:hypothetical protein